MYEIIRYTVDKEQAWDEFVRSAKNATFLCERKYMDYHSNRFTDHSLMFYLKGKLYAVMPANVVGDTLYSHQGLTYGGVIMSNKCTAAPVMAMFDEMNEYLKSEGIRKVIYKHIPHIYSTIPAEEDLYALYRQDAKIIARGLSSAFSLTSLPRWRQDRKTAMNRAIATGLSTSVATEQRDYEEFWKVLQSNLVSRHGVKPVHTVDEMLLLHERFPENIVLYVTRNANGAMVAGVLMYYTGRVAHTQYMSASEEGKKNGALEMTLHTVMHNMPSGAELFDFGISTEDGGNYLNEGLIMQKEGFGGRGICYDTYEWEIK